MIWFVVAAASLVAGIIQSVTGFGSVVFLMMVLPFYFDMIDAPALAIVINQLFCMVLSWKYRRHIQWRVALPPTIAFAVTNLLTMPFVNGLDLQILVLVFAAFLILLALYFLVVAKRVRLAPKPAAGVICGALCGVSAGLFAIGGPPMAYIMWRQRRIMSAIWPACSSSSPSPASPASWAACTAACSGRRSCPMPPQAPSASCWARWWAAGSPES